MKCSMNAQFNTGGALQVDVYAFAMIAYELFEGRKPFGNLHPLEAAQRACINHTRPNWGKLNGSVPPLLSYAAFESKKRPKRT